MSSSVRVCFKSELLANKHPLRSPSLKLLLVFQNWFDRAKLAIEKLVERVGFVGILACASVGSNPFPIFFFRLLSKSNLRLYNTESFLRCAITAFFFLHFLLCKLIASYIFLPIGGFEPRNSGFELDQARSAKCATSTALSPCLGYRKAAIFSKVQGLILKKILTFKANL